MAEDLKQSIDEQHPCRHCGVVGTCEISDGNACEYCMRSVANTKWERFRGKSPRKPLEKPWGPLRCGVCRGKGFVEGLTFKVRNYFPFFFAMLIVGAALYIVATQNITTEKVTTALMGLVGTIVGFYFGGKGSH